MIMIILTFFFFNWSRSGLFLYPAARGPLLARTAQKYDSKQGPIMRQWAPGHSVPSHFVHVEDKKLMSESCQKFSANRFTMTPLSNR